MFMEVTQMEKTCETCKYFRWHYIKMGRWYRRATSGHCVYPRGKLRYADMPACKYHRLKEQPLS